MLNDQINKYNELYTTLVSELAKLHNQNTVFAKTKGRDSGLACRQHLRAIEKLAKALRRQSQFVYKENIVNARAARKLKQEQKKVRKR